MTQHDSIYRMQWKYVKNEYNVTGPTVPFPPNYVNFSNCTRECKAGHLLVIYSWMSNHHDKKKRKKGGNSNIFFSKCKRELCFFISRRWQLKRVVQEFYIYLTRYINRMSMCLDGILQKYICMVTKSWISSMRTNMDWIKT